MGALKRFAGTDETPFYGRVAIFFASVNQLRDGKALGNG